MPTKMLPEAEVGGGVVAVPPVVVELVLTLVVAEVVLVADEVETDVVDLLVVVDLTLVVKVVAAPGWH